MFCFLYQIPILRGHQDHLSHIRKFHIFHLLVLKRFVAVYPKKTIVALLCAMIILAIVVSAAVITTSSMPKPEYSIVIDAGHGGRDVKLEQ